MKKIAVASLLACACGMGFAQSNVQIYGVVDLGITKGNGGASANAGGNGTSNASQVKQASASRLGFRGTEDLGGGWSAGFLLEHRFNPDTGDKSPTAPFFMQSTLSLSSKDFGTMWMGRDYIPAFWVAVKSDPFGMDGVGQVGASTLLADFQSNPADKNASRSNNSVGFKSKRWNGFTADVAYSMSETNDSTPAADKHGSQVGMNVQYQGGPLYAGFGYAKKRDTFSLPRLSTTTTTNMHDELMNLALHYDFGAFRLLGYTARGENKFNNVKSKVYSLGADAKLGNGRLKLAYSEVDSDFAGNDRKKLGVGYDYSLSKMTRMYADVGHGRQKDKSSNTAFAVGIRKAF